MLKGERLVTRIMKCLKHFQFESMMSMTGSNADVRTKIKPSQEGAVVAAIYNGVASAMGGETISVSKSVDVSQGG